MTMNMMSSNRLLLQRLPAASAASALLRIGPLQQHSIHRGISSLVSTRCGANHLRSAVYVHHQFTYPKIHFEGNNTSLFSSAATSPLEIQEDKTVSDTTAKSDDVIETHSEDASLSGEKEVSAAADEVQVQSDDNAKDAPSKNKSKFDDIPPDEVIRTGKIKWIE